MADDKKARLVIDGQQVKGTLKDLQKAASRVRNIMRNLDPELDREKVAKYRAEYEKVNDVINDTKQELGLMRKESVSAVNVFKEFNPLQGLFDEVGDSIRTVQGGVGKLSGRFGALKIAIAATGIGALVVILGSLVAAFASSRQGGMELKTLFNQIKAPIEVIVQRVQQFSVALRNGVLDFDILTKNFTKNVKDQVNSTRELTIEQEALRLQELRTRGTRRESRVEFERLRQVRDDESRSIETRIKANERLGQSISDLFFIEVSLAQQRAENAKEAVRLAGGEQQASFELLEARAEAEAELADLTEEIEGIRSEQLVNRVALEKELNEVLAQRAEIEQQKAAFEETKSRTEGLEELDPAEAPEIIQQQAIDEIALENLQNLEEQKAAIEEESKKKRMAADEAFANFREKMTADALKNSQNYLKSVIGLLNEESEARKQLGVALKSLRIAEIAVSLQKEIQDIWAVSAKFGPAAPGIAIPQTVAAIARAGVATATVAKTKFAEGGELIGASHAAGGIPFTIGGMGGFEAEGGEFLVNKAATRIYKPLLESLNNSVKFAAGGEIPVMQPQFTTPANVPVDGGQNSQMVVQELRALREDFQTLERERKTVLVYSDLESFNNEVAEIRNY